MVDHTTLDLYVRPTFQDAEVATRQIEKGKAKGNTWAANLRAFEQNCFRRLGTSIHRKTHVYFLPLLLGLGVLLAGFKAYDKNSQFDQLWVEMGGRLERELQYSKTALGETESVIHLLLTQTAKESTSPEVPQQRLLHRKALLAHLQLLRAASRVTVNLFDVTWSLKDICLSPSPPDFEFQYIDSIFDTMMPCEIITPLDCFWEGSKLLGPEMPLTVPGVGNSIKWTNLNPLNLMKSIKTKGENVDNFPFDMLETYMKRAGINSGYQEKSCLDPEDLDCPESAPNKKTKKIPDIGAEFSNGCRGFASKYMHWPKELLIGGITHNKTGYIQNAVALQSVLQLMGAKELYESWSSSYKVLHFQWDQEKAALVLRAWQKKFNEEIKKLQDKTTSPSTQVHQQSPYNFYTFSTMLLNDLLSQYDFMEPKLIYIGCCIMVLYVCIVQINFFDALRSQLVIGFFSLLLILLTIASGTGFCCLLGIQIHSATIAVVISITLGMGVNHTFKLMWSYKRISSKISNNTTQNQSDKIGKKQVGKVLKSAGTSILIDTCICLSVFMTAAVVPIPALRAFCLHVAVLNILVFITAIFGVTSLISFDIRRMRSFRIDIFCCFRSKTLKWPFWNNNRSCETASTINDQMHQLTEKSNSPTPTSSNVLLLKESKDQGSDSEYLPVPKKKHFFDLTPNDIAHKYVHYLTTESCRIHVMLFFFITLGVCIWGITKIQAGLTLPEMVPDGTNEQKFLGTYGQMFGFYNMHVVTQGDFEYPTNQKLLYEYHDAFMRVPNILKNDNGGLPQMWLTLFREWLIGLQKSFDKDLNRTCINQEGWQSCATENGILGYKLIVQTGNTDNPIDKSLVWSARLVDENGFINEETFYNLLTAWASNDILAYGASQANIRPEPRRWTHVANDFDLQIVKSSPITYAQMPFYANSLYETPVITKFISTVRDICNHYDMRGLPNYPSGIPFVYWEQYQELNQYFFIAISFTFLCLFVISWLFLCNFRAACIVVIMSAVHIIQMLGFMGFCGIKFSAIPVVLLICTIGTGVIFSIHLSLSFVTCIGDRPRRTYLCIDHMAKLILQSAFTLITGVIVLAFQNNYVSRTYFLLLCATIFFCTFNGLVILPILLFMFGPSPEIKPLEHPDRISTPSPEPIKKHNRYTSMRKSVPPPPSNRTHHHHRHHHSKNKHRDKKHHEIDSTISLQYAPREGSLSTIAEESGSYRSGSPIRLEKTKSQQSLSESSSSSSSLYNYSVDSGSEIDEPPRTQSRGSSTSSRTQSRRSTTPPRTHSRGLTPTPPTPTRCVVRAQFEVELDGKVMSTSTQPCVHTSSSSSKHGYNGYNHSSNRQPKRHKRPNNTRY